MKRCVTLLLCVLFCLSGCTAQEVPARPTGTEEENKMTAQTLAAAVAGSQNDDGLTELSGEILIGYLNSLGLTGWKDAAVLTGQGMDAREITVVRMADASAAGQAARRLEDHRAARIGDFFGYAPDQVELLEQALVLTQGEFAAFFVCSDAKTAKAVFAACFDGGVSEYVPASVPEPTPTASELPEVTAEPTAAAGPSASDPDLDISTFPVYRQPGDVDMTIYDHSAVVTAWKTGNVEALSDTDRAILTRCREAFAEAVHDDMTEPEIELALHDWLMANGAYDDLSRDNVAHIGRPNNTNPYGMLVDGYGICLGFATTFQLLMDLAGIECVTVIGAAYDSTADHAWNVVRLDGAWYCVDVTWNNSYEDMGSDDRHTHKYFNVTSDFLREQNHQWDYRNVPEAGDSRYAWKNIK